MHSIQFCTDNRLRRILRQFSGIWSTDVTQVAVGESGFAGAVGASALAVSNTILFRPGRLDLESEPGVALLGHELAHVLQQRRISSAEGTRLLNDQKLEDDANEMGARAAALVWRQNCERPASQRARPEMTRPFALHPDDIHDNIQRKIDVGGDVYEKGIAPLSSWGLSEEQKTFYNFLLGASDRTFYFADRARMLAFVKSPMMLRIFKNTDSFQGPRMLSYFDEIKSVTPQALQKRDTNWCVPLTVTTAKGSLTVNVYCSVKRHLITTFMRSQFTPVDHKETNIAVRDGDAMGTKLAAYAAYQAQKIRDNRMLYGYDPKAADAGYADGQIKFATDTIFMPSTGWAFDNPIHSFPESGSLTKSLSQEEHKALTTFLLWFFRTEEHLSEGTKFNKISRLDGQHKDMAEDDVRQKTAAAKKSLQTLKDVYKVNFPIAPDKLDETAASLQATFLLDKKVPHYNKLLPDAGKRLHFVLATTGEIPAINKPLIAPKDKAAGLKAASTAVGGPEVRFKTHKVEVRKWIGFLTPDLVAWAIEGHTAVSADNIITAISTSTKVKSHVNAQIAAAESDLENQMKNVKTALTKVGELAQIAYAKSIITLT
jgi:hypothetical protein